MATYLVELYADPLGSDTLGRAAREARAAAAGTEVRHLSTILVPEDETCLHLFESPSEQALRRVLDRAAFPTARVAEAYARKETP